MPLQPIARRSVTDEVFAQLSAEVLSGDLAAGENLPSERRLAEVLGVSRPSVRQALQRLANAGLVDVRHGDATTVRDFRRTAGLSLLPQLLLAGGGLDIGVVRSILETRLLVGPFAAGLAAERGNASLKPPLDRVLDELAAAADPVARQRVALDFWDVIIDGADSITIRLMYNNLRSAYEPVIEALAHVMDAEALRCETYRELADAITGGEVVRARGVADALLRPSTDSLLAAFDDAEVTT
jgi:DNA-binding FadR family transcriptional regulator